MTDKVKKRKKKSKKLPYSYKYLGQEIYKGKRPGDFLIERYQRPKTMSDMQMHQAAMAHETSVINPKTLKEEERKHFKDESGRVVSYARRKKKGQWAAKGGSVKKYANGGSVRAARF